MAIEKTSGVISGKATKHFICKLADVANLLTDSQTQDCAPGSTCYIIDAKDVAMLQGGHWTSMKDGVTVYGE